MLGGTGLHFLFLEVLQLYLTISSYFSSTLTVCRFLKVVTSCRWPTYRACLVNLHPHRIFWTTAHGYNVGCSLSLRPRRLCGSWCPWAHLEFPSPSWQISGSLWVLEGHILETHSMDALVNADGVFSGHYPADGRTALLLAILLCGRHYARPGLERKSMKYCGKGKAGLQACISFFYSITHVIHFLRE